MQGAATLLVTLAMAAASAQAFTLNYKNKCSYNILAAIARAPNGQPDSSFHWGGVVGANGGTNSHSIADTTTGVRSWARTGCNSAGNNCATGGCVGGTDCTDGGLNSNAIVAEFGYANFGAQYGGERISWDLSHVNLAVNVPVSVTDNAGQTVTCTSASCAANQAYNTPTDYAADRNSALGTTFTITYCP